MKRCVLILPLILAAALAQVAKADGDGWLVDFEKAKATAKKEGKDVLMEFTGSDWCPPCIALNKQVLSTALFKEAAPKMFVLLKLDSPRDKSKQTPEEIKQNQRLSVEYQVQGVPNVVLADHLGRPYARIGGFRGEKPEEYIEKLKNLQQIRVERDKFMKQAEKASGVDKAKALDGALARLDKEIVASFYGKVVNEIVKIDSDGKAGLKSKYESVLQKQREMMFAKSLQGLQGEIQGALQAAAKKAQGGRVALTAIQPQVDKVVAKLDKMIAKEKPTKGALQQALFFKSQLKFGSDKKEAQKLLEEAHAAMPTSRMAGQIKRILTQVFKADAASEEKKESTKEAKKEEKK